MPTTRRLHIRRSTLLVLFHLLLAFASPAFGQVGVERVNGQVIISIPGHATQEASQLTGKTTSSGWMLHDNVGNSYQADIYAPILVAEYLDGEPGSDPPPPPPPGGSGGGYQDVLDLLMQVHGAVVNHDSTLGIDQLTFPSAADPFDTFFDAIVNDSVGGEPLMHHLGLIELTGEGLFDDPIYTDPAGSTPFAFPNDPHYVDQWNLIETLMAKVIWHPTATAQKTVRISVIDSGVETADQTHTGLDGVTLHHRALAPDTPVQATHGLGVVSFLADGNDDGSGIASPLGSWSTAGNCTTAPLLDGFTPEIYSYHVGDAKPDQIQVAAALRQSIDDGVDVINLSLRLAYSPVIVELIEEALSKNIIVVAAAGNYDPAATAKPTAFPANVPGVIAVGSAGTDKQYSSTSAVDSVDIRAPGVNILVGGPANAWKTANGTSFAAPHVTAALAMMRAVDSTLTPTAALAALQQGATNVDAQGVGFLNVGNAFNEILPATQQVVWDLVPLPENCIGPSKHSGAPTTPAAETATAELPQRPTLEGNYPNPFNPQTTIRFQLPEAQAVRLAVYNALGQRVRLLADGLLSAGTHDVTFEARDLPSGTYFYRLESDAGVVTRSMILMK